MAPLYFCRFGRKPMLVEDADVYEQARPRGTAGLWSNRLALHAINSEDKLLVTSTPAPSCSVAPPLPFAALPLS